MNFSNKLINFLKKYKSFFINSCLPLIIFIILFLMYYPGIMTYDGNNQWEQVQNGIISNAHPFFSTYFMYLLSKIHNSTSIIIFYQMFLFSIIWGFFCQIIKTSKKFEIIKYLFTIIICFTPIIGIYSITLWKDIIYSYYLMLISVLIFIGIKKDFNYGLVHYLIIGVSLSFIFSYRHNGIIVAIFLLILFLIILIRKKLLKKFLLIIVPFVTIIFLISIPKEIYLSKSSQLNKNTQQINISSIDSYILWMMGAHLNNNNINEKNKKFLNKIIDCNNWKEAYDPFLINSVTTLNINKKFVNENSNKLRKIFLEASLKNPETILIHYLKADSLLLSPISIKGEYVYAFSFTEWSMPMGFEEIINSKLPLLKNIYNKIINFTFMIPFSIYQPAIYLYLSIIMLIILSKIVYGKKIFLVGTPMFFNTISLLPINLAQDLRYVYINFLTFFLILLLFVINYKNIFKIKDSSL